MLDFSDLNEKLKKMFPDASEIIFGHVKSYILEDIENSKAPTELNQQYRKTRKKILAIETKALTRLGKLEPFRETVSPEEGVKCLFCESYKRINFSTELSKAYNFCDQCLVSLYQICVAIDQEE